MEETQRGEGVFSEGIKSFSLCLRILWSLEGLEEQNNERGFHPVALEKLIVQFFNSEVGSVQFTHGNLTSLHKLAMFSKAKQWRNKEALKLCV